VARRPVSFSPGARRSFTAAVNRAAARAKGPSPEWELGAIARSVLHVSGQRPENPYTAGSRQASEWDAGWAHEDAELGAGR
jgi:hypothetical protein